VLGGRKSVDFARNCYAAGKQCGRRFLMQMLTSLWDFERIDEECKPNRQKIVVILNEFADFVMAVTSPGVFDLS
jgi:hypothetical protein